MPVKHFRIAIAALGLALLAACSQDVSAALKPVKTSEAELIERIDRLIAKPPTLKAETAANVDIVIAALPSELALTYAASTLDAATGATVLTDVAITPADAPAVGVSIAKLSLWALDAELAAARLRGQRLSEAAPLARRIELEGVSLFRLDAILAQAAAVDTETRVLDEPFTLDTATFAIERLVFEDVRLRPWEIRYARLPDDNDFVEAMPIFQTIAALTRSFAYDTGAMNDLRFNMDITEDGEPGNINMSVERAGWRGQRGADLDFGFARNMRVSALSPVATPEALDDGTYVMTARSMEMLQSVDRTTFSGMRLDKLLGYLARGQVPPRSDTDLMSVGLIESHDINVDMQGAQVYAIESYTLDFSRFHWLIPTRARYDVRNFQIDAETFMAIAEDFGAYPPDDDVVLIDPETGEVTYEPVPESSTEPDLAAVMAVVSKHGLSRPSIDFSLGYDWNAKSGAGTTDFELGLDDWVRASSKSNLTTPSFDEVSTLISDSGNADETTMEALFRDKMAFGASSLVLIDEGGLSKSFALAADMAKLAPADDPALGMFRAATPQSLRQMAVSGMYLLADTAGQEEPVLRDLLRPLAAWLDKGGRVEWKMAPASPVTVTTLESAGQDPAALMQKLGLKAVHTPPAK